MNGLRYPNSLRELTGSRIYARRSVFIEAALVIDLSIKISLILIGLGKWQ